MRDLVVKQNPADTHPQKERPILAMSTTNHVYASAMTPKVSPTRDLPRVTLAQPMFVLMLRHVASDGFVFTNPANPQSFSQPGCIMAALSFPDNTPGADQDYVFNWMVDSSMHPIEIAAANPQPFPVNTS